MTFSLHASTVASFQQTLGAVMGLLDKAESYCADKNIAPAELIQARLADDMLPFAYQVKSTVEHSVGAIEGVRKGVFSPSTAPFPDSFPALRQLLSNARTTLDAIDPQEIDGFVGRDMRFEFRAHRMEFTAENFLLSFSLPNFYFHAATAYDILRMNGVKIGKRDFLGELRLKQ
jgi:uncharacterized protein